MSKVLAIGGVSTPAVNGDLLVLEGISAKYGETPVVREVSISVPSGALIALLGANGAGKTSVLKAASGLLKTTAGKVLLSGTDVTRRPAFRRSEAGICFIPKRSVFQSLTVRENLALLTPPWVETARLDIALDVFPALGKRLDQTAGTLSGGEQQMLAMTRAVLAEPAVILVDEISMGLSPQMIDILFEALGVIAAAGTAMIIVEQYVQRALDMCSFVYVMKKGRVVHSGPSSELDRDTVVQTYLGFG